MTANALIQARIDPEVKARATEVLGALGLTVSDAVSHSAHAHCPRRRAAVRADGGNLGL
ncbi:MAG TPA: type II toxin-antitoxin system RelB/DinJ family antitoxin [Caulobacteraceae bacterium]|nr:type II toxin-antitoxin system RelB/DinJ family antitoxin [Caulobacteraceae bacterium]